MSMLTTPIITLSSINAFKLFQATHTGLEFDMPSSMMSKSAERAFKTERFMKYCGKISDKIISMGSASFAREMYGSALSRVRINPALSAWRMQGAPKLLKMSRRKRQQVGRQDVRSWIECTEGKRNLLTSETTRN